MNTDTVQTMWNTRPARIPASQGGNAKIAGVCEGIGVRYQVDPTLIRILFVAAGLIGGGLGVYLVAWLIMPRFSMQYSPIEAVLKNLDDTYKKEKETGWWLIVALLIFGFSASSGELLSGTTVISLALAFGAWYLLHNQNPTPPDTSNFGINAAPGFVAPTPPAWDPLGTVPELWHLPEPGSASPVNPPKKNHGWLWIAGAIVVLGIGSLLSTVDVVRSDNFAHTDVSITVTQETDLDPHYENGMGNLELDLSELQPLTEDRQIVLENGIGDVELTLPREVPVLLECENGIGDSECQPGRHGPATGNVLKIRIENGIGHVGVTY